MAFRIDPQTMQATNADGEAIPVSAEQQQAYETAVNQMLSERERAGGAGELDPDNESVVVIESGDNLWDIAQDYDVSHQDLIGANGFQLDGNPDLIHPQDALVLPSAGPVASHEDFLNDLHMRGNALEYADPALSGEEMDREVAAISTDVVNYVQSLSPEDQQQFWQDVSERDWTDAGPTGMAIEQALETMQSGPDGAQGNPNTFADSLYTQGNQAEYSEPPLGGDAMDLEVTAMASNVVTHIQGLPPEQRQQALQDLSERDWTDAGPAGMAVEQAAETLALNDDGTLGNPDAFADSLHAQGNAAEYSDPALGGEAMDRTVDDMATNIITHIRTLPAEEQRQALLDLSQRDWTDAGPAGMAVEQAAEALDVDLG